MEITLTLDANELITVHLAGAPSHSAALARLLPNKDDPAAPPQPLLDPAGYGQALFAALFPRGSPAAAALAAERANTPACLRIWAADAILDGLPWEYAHDGADFLACELDFVRAVAPRTDPAAPAQPAAPADPSGPLSVVAVCASPVDEGTPPLHVEPEWQRLKDIFQGLPNAASLERVRPPTFEQLGLHLYEGGSAVLHFTGHGSSGDGQAQLCFESESGALQRIGARELSRELKGKAFLAVLSACISAAPGPTAFSNLARLLAEQGMPYALGMRFSVVEADALAFTRHLYQGLAAGWAIEPAVTRARAALARGNPRAWAVGVPVLYSSLPAPARGFRKEAGAVRVRDTCPPVSLADLPPVQGAFQGRVEEQIVLGRLLTGDVRPRYLTICGTGGQGKTALARALAERCAWAWPGGVYALSLENLPGRGDLLVKLNELLGLALPTPPEARAVERQVLARLADRRALLIFDNCETLIEAVDAKDAGAIRTAALLREGFPPATGLLFTSRRAFGFGQAEAILELEGLTEAAGAGLFLESAGQRAGRVSMAEAQQLSRRLSGHPLSLRLLGLAFAETPQEFAGFYADLDRHMLGAADKYKQLDHRQRTLFASLDASTAYLSPAQLETLAGLRLFLAPFLPETAAEVLDPGVEDSPVLEHLHTLWQRGLLLRQFVKQGDESLLLYSLLPPIRLYARLALPAAPAEETLAARYAQACARLLEAVFDVRQKGGVLLRLGLVCEADFDQDIALLPAAQRAVSAGRWGFLLYRLGNPVKGLRVLEAALALVQGSATDEESFILDSMGHIYSGTGSPALALKARLRALKIDQVLNNRKGEATTLTNIGTVYSKTGQSQEALRFLNLALPIHEEVGDRAGFAATLTQIGTVYSKTGQPQEALGFFNRALPILEEVGDRDGLASTLHAMGTAYSRTGQPQEALGFFNRALPIREEVGDRAGVAATLHQIGSVCLQTGQPQEALSYLNRALPILEEVGNRTGRASTLYQIGSVYLETGQIDQAIPLFEEGIRLDRLSGAVHAEAGDLFNLAGIFHTRLGRTQEAIALIQSSIQLFEQHHFERDDARRSLADHTAFLAQLQSGQPTASDPEDPMPAIQALVGAGSLDEIRTILETRPILFSHPEVEAIFEQNIQQKQAQNPEFAQKLTFFLGLLRDAKANGVPDALARLEAAMRPSEEAAPAPAGLPADFVSRAARGLSGAPQDKIELYNWLGTLAPAAQPADKLLLDQLQQAIFSSNPAALAVDLPAPQLALWREILSHL